MPEFLMRYKPGLKAQALEMALSVTALASKLFEMEVAWEAREFDDCFGQPDFVVTGWITDNDDIYRVTVFLVQQKILTLMRLHAYKDQTVGCWWQRVKGNWGDDTGLLERP